jgi:hypothetical protein
MTRADNSAGGGRAGRHARSAHAGKCGLTAAEAPGEMHELFQTQGEANLTAEGSTAARTWEDGDGLGGVRAGG